MINLKTTDVSMMILWTTAGILKSHSWLFVKFYPLWSVDFVCIESLFGTIIYWN